MKNNLILQLLEIINEEHLKNNLILQFLEIRKITILIIMIKSNNDRVYKRFFHKKKNNRFESESKMKIKRNRRQYLTSSRMLI